MVCKGNALCVCLCVCVCVCVVRELCSIGVIVFEWCVLGVMKTSQTPLLHMSSECVAQYN